MSNRRTILVLLLLVTSLLAACSPGHTGGNEIAFLRDGHLWTMDPDGANAFEVVAESTSVIGYGWSPTHQLLTYRTLDPTYAKTSTGKTLVMNSLTEQFADVPSAQNTIGIDGGSPVPILFSSSDVSLSNAWWNDTGSRLLYREESTSSTPTSSNALWWLSQNDQPGGIARKLLPSSFSIPSIATDNSMTIGNSFRGLFSTALDGSHLQFLIQDKLPGHPLPATLERTLVQPNHSNPVVLYATTSTTLPPSSFNTKPSSIQLIISDTKGQANTLTTCTCSQFAWSPDGNTILYNSGTTYTVLRISNKSSFSITTENGSIPYWSPDSQFLILDSYHSLTLLNVAQQQSQVLLSDTTGTQGLSSSTPSLANSNALLQPQSNSPWSADSRHFLFLTRGRLLWQGKSLNSGQGLYTVAIDDQGKPQAIPVLADANKDTQAGWTFENPDTSFLFA